MAIISSGFDGTVDEVQYAKMWGLGGLDACSGIGWQVTQANSTNVNVALGEAFAKGVLSVSDSQIVQPITRPSSGSTWMVVVRRINWSINTVGVAVVPTNVFDSGTTAPTAPPSVLPGGVNNQPGSLYDHVLAWVWVNSGTGMAIFDLRSQPPADRLAALDAGVLRLDTNRGTAAQRDAKYGVPTTDAQRIALQGRRWYNSDLGVWEQYFAVGSTGNPLGAVNAGWFPDDSGTVNLTTAMLGTGFLAGAGGVAYRRRGGTVFIGGVLGTDSGTRTGTFFTLPVGFRPTVRHSSVAQASASNVAEFTVGVDGTCSLGTRASSTTTMTIAASFVAVP